jgi:hypothetical protein
LPRAEFLDYLEVRVFFDVRDEPAIIGVNAVEQPEIVVAKIELDKSAKYPLPSG